MLNPPGCLLPIPRNGSLDVSERSSGLLQGTGLAASTTKSVLEVPSVTLPSGTPDDSPVNIERGSTTTWYVVML